MGLAIEPVWLLWFCAGLVLLYLIGRWFTEPFKRLGRFFLSAATGILFMLAVDVLAGGAFFIPVNALSAVCAGTLGLPGIALAYGLYMLL